jgi:hypothetical protein
MRNFHIIFSLVLMIGCTIFGVACLMLSIEQQEPMILSMSIVSFGLVVFAYITMKAQYNDTKEI